MGQGFPGVGVFRGALDAVIVIDGSGLVRDWNPASEALFGYSWDEAVGRELAELIIPGPLRDAHRNGLRRFQETQEPVLLGRRVEVTALRRDGSEIPVELTLTRIPESDPVLFAGFVRRLSEREATAEENVRLQQRLGFLSQAGLVLDRSLDYNDTLRRLANLTVPELAQLTVIDLLDEHGTIRTTVAAAADPGTAHAVEAMRASNPLELSTSHPVARVLRDRQSMLLATMSRAFLRDIAQGEEHFELMRELGYHSAIVVPLIARGRALGTVSLLRMLDARAFDEDDLVLAEELARRAALAVDNARLFEATRYVARTLQQSLLPRDLPDIPGVQITGRYRPADREQDVGGDFYDAFAIDENRWGVAIGDVCGKGAEAAALTALARYTIRALADRDPAAVLRRLNDTVMRERDLIRNRYLTVMFAVASLRFGMLNVELAVGGHPAPLVLRADGSVSRVAAAGPMVGMMPDVEFRPTQIALEPGDTMLVYTDGLTDARAPQRILTDDDLMGLLASGRPLRGSRLAAFLEHAARGGEGARDDIALLLIEL